MQCWYEWQRNSRLSQEVLTKMSKLKSSAKGNWVLSKVFENTQEPNTDKLGPKWEPPYQISKVIGNGGYQLIRRDGTMTPRS